nr:hypothetical protein CFP56_01877 [Quercus suber]
MVTWAIWNRRNNLHLGKVAASLDELLSQSLDRIQDFKLNNSSLATTVGHPPTRWQAPDQDNYKVNFNGALFSEANTADNRNPDLFSMVTWAIWNRRNNLHLGKVAASLDELLSQSLDRIQDFKLNNSSLATTVGHPPTRWQAPDQDNYKVNFNGALFSEANTAG